MFVHNIDPVLFRIWEIEIRYYGIIYAFGFLFSLWYLLKLSREKRLGLNEEEVYDFMVYEIIGVVIGARLFEILFYEPAYYFSNPGQIIAYWNGGLSFHGGLAGGLFAGWLFLRKAKNRITFLELADATLIPVSLGLALGRIANFINGELFGKITGMPWGVKFSSTEGFRHPTQIYESLKNLAIFLALHSIHKKKHRQGLVFWLFVTMYGGLRFAIEFLKEPGTVFLGIPVGQAFSLVMFSAGIYVIFTKYSK